MLYGLRTKRRDRLGRLNLKQLHIFQASWINSSTRTQTHTAPASSIEASRIHKAAKVPGTLHAHKAAQHKQRTVLGPMAAAGRGQPSGTAQMATRERR